MGEEVLVQLLEQDEVYVVQQQLRTLVVLLLEGVGALPDDDVYDFAEILRGEVLELLLELHFLVIGNLVLVFLLLEEVVLDWPSLLALAGAWLS
jgi:hypothetical protein